MVKVEFKSEGPSVTSPYLVEQNGRQFEFQIPATLSAGELLEQLNLDLKSVNDIQIREGNLEDAFRHVLGESL
jgi:hypothetical protein